MVVGSTLILACKAGIHIIFSSYTYKTNNKLISLQTKTPPTSPAQYVAKVSVTCVANYYFSGYCAQHRIFLRKILFAKSTYNINTFTHRFKNIFNLVKYELCFNFFWWVWWAFRFVVNFKANWSLAMSLSLILSTRNFGILKFNYIWLIMQSFAFSWGIDDGVVAFLLRMAYFGGKIQHTSIFGY